MSAPRYIVSIDGEDFEGPVIHGTYTDDRARRIVEILNVELQAAMDRGEFSWTYATCYPIRPRPLDEIRDNLGLGS